MRISDWSSDVCSSDLDLDRLEHADAALESGAAARLAALGPPDDGADVEPEYRGDAVVGLDGFAAIVAKFAHKALRKDGAEGRGQKKRLYFQILKARYRADRIIGVDGDRKSTRLNSRH